MIEKSVQLKCDGCPGPNGAFLQVPATVEVTIGRRKGASITSSEVNCKYGQPSGGHGGIRCTAQSEYLEKGEKSPLCPYSFDFPHVREVMPNWQPPPGIFDAFRTVATAARSG